MKKVMVFLLAVCMLFSAVGCSALSELASQETVFSVGGYDLQITADSSFREQAESNFDLQLSNNKCYISIMAYEYIDFPEGTTARDIYTFHIEDLLGKRSNVAVIEEETTQTLSQKNIIQALHSAERDGVKNYYASYLIDLPEKEACAWVLVSATPSYLNNNREYLHNIVCSLS